MQIFMNPFRVSKTTIKLVGSTMGDMPYSTVDPPSLSGAVLQYLANIDALM